MKKTFYAKLCVWALSALACLCFSQAYAQNADGPEKDTVKIEKELPSGGAIVIQKVGQEAAFATLEIDGEKVEIDAFEPLTRFPEERARSSKKRGTNLERSRKTINVEIDVTEAPEPPNGQSALRAASSTVPEDRRHARRRRGVDQIPTISRLSWSSKTWTASRTRRDARSRVEPLHQAQSARFWLVVHETTHVAQAYPLPRSVGDGRLDRLHSLLYYRSALEEPLARRPERSKYTDSYGITATYFDWIVRNVDPNSSRRFTASSDQRGSVERFVVSEYDKTCQGTLGRIYCKFKHPNGQR